MYARTLESATPMSTPPAPPTVSDLKKSTAETLTDWAPFAPAAGLSQLRVPSQLTFELGPTNAFVVTFMTVTPTPPATPTKPPPIAGARPNTSSLDVPWT